MQDWINHRLPELLEEHGVVGAQLAVLVDGEIHDAAAGVLKTATGEAVTTGSLFQIASITKLWTATLVQQLVNDGLLDLDRPVRDVLPDFHLADEQAAAALTPRHLLTHTGGFEGDLFWDTGTDDEAVARYVTRLAEAAQLTPPGAVWSYCNSGFTVLGRIVEVLRGKPFNTVLRERIADPLGIEVATTLAEGLDHGAATGHVPEDGAMKPVDDPGPESDWPAGSALALSGRSLLEFVRMHLQTDAYASMREPQVTLPSLSTQSSWGLGWEVLNANGGVVIGHNGANLGTTSDLRVVPAAGVAIAILANSGDGWAFIRDASRHLLDELAGVQMPARAKPPVEPIAVDVERVVGVYRSAGTDMHITPGESGRVHVRYAPNNELTGSVTEGKVREYTGLRDDALIAVEEPHSVIALLGPDLIHFGQSAVRL